MVAVTDFPPSFTGPLGQHIGIDVSEVTADRVVATWFAGEHLHQPFGLVNGGAHCTVVETLASIGGAAWLGERGQVVGVNNNTDFYRGVSDGQLLSTATPVHRGRSQQVWVVETLDNQGRLIARGQVRLHNLYPRD
jgi:1,4-dihydroxy-2-naphthoyl-CoA hydrolase